MRRGILATVLVIQLILLILVTFSTVQEKSASFAMTDKYHRLSAYRIASAFADIHHDIEYLKTLNATNETIDSYISFVNQTFKEEYLMDINISSSYLIIEDKALEMKKEGVI